MIRNAGAQAAIGLVTAVISWYVWCLVLPGPRLFRVTFLDVGQGDAIVVETPGGRTLVVDAGPRAGESSQGMRVVVPFLRSRGIQAVDGLLLTHPDEDHIGGAADILDRVPVKRLFVTGLGPSNATMREVLSVASRRSTQLVYLAAGQQIRFGDGVTAAVLHPGPATDPGADNDNSIVVRLSFGRTSILLTGDAEAGAEEEMLSAREPVAADVLKLGHHGSRTSTTQPFLSAVHPQAAVVSCGRHNVFGHPNHEVVDRLATAGIPLFRTDTDGAVSIVTDGTRIWIQRTVRAQAPARG